MLFENPLANAIRGSFREWCFLTSRTKSDLKKLSDEALRMIHIGMGELNTYGPGPWWTWYVRNHMRFKIRGDELRVVMDLTQSYLADYAHGRLSRKTEEKKETEKKENEENNATKKADRKTKGSIVN